jgi:hypothetical protein
MLRHCVFFKYRPGTAESHIEEFCRRMRALRGTVPGIEHLAIGRDVLRDGRSWDLLLDMRFASVDALRGYQRHPDHRTVMAFNDPAVADVGTIDFHEGDPA